jgi:hypothetical protein
MPPFVWLAQLPSLPFVFEYYLSLACSVSVKQSAAAWSAIRRRERRLKIPPATRMRNGAIQSSQVSGFKVAVALNEKRPDLLVCIACRQPLADEKPQITGKIGARFVNRFVLADSAIARKARGRGLRAFGRP